MTELLITIKTLSPLYAGALKPYGSFLETQAEIPGGLLRGAVAQKTLPRCSSPDRIDNHEDCEEKDSCPFYYLTTGVRFPICVVSEGRFPTHPPLRTMVTCKVAPGFKSQTTHHDPKHGVFDTLISHLLFNESSRHYGHQESLPLLECPTCNAPLEPFASRYLLEHPGWYHSVPSPVRRRVTRVGINRRLETSEPGLLYSVQTIAKGYQFSGVAYVPDTWGRGRIEEFKNILESITCIGGEQTYGLGVVEVEVKEFEDRAEDILSRILGFNEKLKEGREENRDQKDFFPPEGNFFTVDLLTPAILTTDDGTPTVQLTGAMLKRRAEELGYLDLPEVEQVTFQDEAGRRRPLMFTAPMVVSGWSEAWGLPKPTALAAVAGSVYVFRSEDIRSWSNALRDIEAQGIGGRREEGFGAIRICDSIHREVKPI